MSETLRRAFILYAVLLIGLVIAAGRGVLPVDAIHRIPYADKLGHFVLMGLLSFLAHLAWRSRDRRGWRINAVLIAVVTIEEVSQLGISHRRFDLADLAADVAGIVVFGWLGMFGAREGILRISRPAR